MDAADVHACVLIATVIVPVLAAALWFGVPQVRRIGAGAILAVVLTLAASVYIAPHAAGESPFTQWLLPALVLFLVVPFVRVHLLRIGLFAAVFGLGLALSLNYGMLTQPQSGYIGTPHLPPELARVRGDQSAAALGMLLARSKEDDTDYPPGFLDEPPLDAALARYMNVPLQAETFAVSPCLHSRLTRIWRLRTVRLALWYPGGKLCDGARGIGLRERHEPPPG
jgi:hypothetical protein